MTRTGSSTYLVQTVSHGVTTERPKESGNGGKAKGKGKETENGVHKRYKKRRNYESGTS